MSQQALRFLQRSLQIATVCGAVPITAGILTYLTWVLLEWQPIATAAFYVAFLGSLMFVMGVVAFVGALVVARKLRVTDHPAFRKSAATAFTLLSINIPTGIVLTVAGHESYTAYRLILENQSGHSYPDATLLAGDREIAIPLKPGETVKKKLKDVKGASLSLRLARDSQPVLVEGYVTPGLPTARVIVNPDGTLSTPDITRKD